jgi:hypothetical protein
MHLLSGAIEAGMQNDEGPTSVGTIYAMEVARQSGVLVRDFDWLDRRIVEPGTSAVALNRLPIGNIDPWILRISMQEELRSTVVG